MYIDTDSAKESNDFVVVEDGEHLLRIGSAREVTNADGEVAWMLRLEVVDGSMSGRTAVVDWLNFKPKGMDRVTRILAALGFDTSKPMDLDPSDVVGRCAVLRLVTQESTRPTDGQTVRRSRVTYDGWAPAPDGATGWVDQGDTDEAEGAAGVEPDAIGAGDGGGGSGSTMAADAMPF